QGLRIAMGQAEPPLTPVVARAVWYQVGLRRQCMQVMPERGEIHGGADRLGVADDVQVVPSELCEPIAVGCLDPSVLYVPLERHFPVERLAAGRYLVDGERDALADDAQRTANAVAGDAAADGVEPLGERVQLLARGACAHDSGLA